MTNTSYVYWPFELSAFATLSSNLQATSSGDRSSSIVDVAAQRKVAVLDAHTLTVKTTLWNPSNPST